MNQICLFKYGYISKTTIRKKKVPTGYVLNYITHVKF